ncbi:hypothetical protein, partial [Methylobacterium tardum]|uniref:hypothetical protein n=1 Tax=Methylobacterium tardum TaxID=374432 RepID=UPI001EE124DD
RTHSIKQASFNEDNHDISADEGFEKALLNDAERNFRSTRERTGSSEWTTISIMKRPLTREIRSRIGGQGLEKVVITTKATDDSGFEEWS